MTEKHKFKLIDKLRWLYNSFISKQLIGSLTASDMPTLTKSDFDFENLLVLEKMLKNLELEQNMFSFAYFQLDWELVMIRRVGFFTKSSQIQGGW